MYKVPAFILALFLATSNLTYAQKVLSVENLKQITEQKNTAVYVSALWCLPCVKKLKETSDSLANVMDTSVRHIVVFDRLAFDWSKINKINLDGFDSSSIYLIPVKYYSRSFIQINPSNKVLRKYMADLKRGFHSPENIKKFWFGDFFIVTNHEIVFKEK